jgi:hypothetical protein
LAAVSQIEEDRPKGKGEMTDRNGYKKWTPEDDEFLRNLVLADVSPFDIAAQLGRSVSTVKGRAHCLGITLRRSGVAPVLTREANPRNQ